MRTNKLYAYIRQVQKKETEIPLLSPFQFKKLTDKNGISYYLSELEFLSYSLQGKANVKISLEKHHLSFYEAYDPNNPKLSEYHYTGYFRDNDNNKYRLHVHFDTRDQCVGVPIFSVWDEVSQVYVGTDIFASIKEESISFACVTSKAPIASLRASRHDEYSRQ